MVAHVLANVGPDRQQHALAFVVASAVLVRLTEVPDHDRAVYGADDLAERYLLGHAREDVTTADAAFRADQPGTFERKQDLFQVRLREAGPLGDVSNGGRRVLLTEGQGE